MASKKPKEAASLPWRPNFVNPALLPDTKVIRTNFLYNIAAVGLVIALGAFVALHEFQISVLSRQLKEEQAKIEQINSTHTRAVRDSKTFDTNSARLKEAVAFEGVSFQRSDLLAVLAQADSRDIVLSSANLRPIVEVTGRGAKAKRSIRYELAIQGDALNAATADQAIKAFCDAVVANPALAPYDPEWRPDVFSVAIATNTASFSGRFTLTMPANP